MATIRKRGDFQWQAQVRRKGFPIQTHTFETKASALAWSRMIEREMDTGVWRPHKGAESTTLEECLIRYEREVTASKKGWRQEKNRIKHIRAHALASCFMSSIRGKDIAEYRDERLATGISASTYQKEHALLSHLFTVPRREQGMESIINPVELVSRPAIHLSDSKNFTARDVPLSRRAVDVLSGLPRRLDGQVFKTGANFITVGFGRICKSAKSLDGKKGEPIEDLRFHDLRHEATSRLFEKGLNPMQVAAIAGHKTLQMLKRYTHLRAEDLAKMLG